VELAQISGRHTARAHAGGPGMNKWAYIVTMLVIAGISGGAWGLWSLLLMMNINNPRQP
jgi:hypothetical protein